MLDTLPEPAKTGHTFIGWFITLTDTIAVTDSTVFENDTTIYAQWTPKTYKVTFNSQNGSAVDSQLIKYGGKITAPATALTRTAYTFGGWYKDTLYTAAWNFAADTVTAAVTLYAKWTLNVYAVAFDSKGGGAVDTQSITHGGKVTYPTAPTRTGYTFGGWWKDAGYAAAWDFADDTVTSAITLYAKWTLNKYAVTFNPQSGSEVSAQSIEHGGKATEPKDPTRATYTFGGWFKEAACTNAWNFATDTVTAAVTLYAKWTLNKYTVTFDSHDGTAVPAQSIEHGGKVVEPTTDPTRTGGYNFDGWFKEAACTNDWDFAEETVTGPVTLYAKWTTLDIHVVKFDSRGGSAVSSHRVEHNAKTTEPKDPTRAGFNFDGWYKDSLYTPAAAWDFDVDKVTASITLYAKWTTLVVFTVTFDAKGGSALNHQLVENGKTAVQHPSARAGYTLEGWYKEAAYTTKWNFTSPVTANMTLYANWTPIDYNITYDLILTEVTVSPPNPPKYTIETPVFTLNNPEREGYTFNGWTGPNGDDPHKIVVISQGSTGDKTFAADWTAIVYNITYALNGGTVPSDAPNPTTYTVADVITLTNPTKPSWTFAGWTGANGTTKQTTVTISNSTGAKSYTANWEFYYDPTKVLTDSRDGKKYNTVVIGTQTWMAENLNYAGDDVDNPLGACYNNDDDNCAKYGRLYKWSEAMDGSAASSLDPSGVQGACPVGWHLPSEAELNTFAIYVGGSAKNQSHQLKSLEGWPSTSASPPTNVTGFNALPSGNYLGSAFGALGTTAYWWGSSTNASNDPVYLTINSNNNFIQVVNYSGYDFSIRCVED
jgi:uncharacterized protein (TIGR02145 family)/uncharacterized repeat protein (TIGR02543 family)